MIKNQFNKTVKYFRSDEEAEFGLTIDILKTEGIAFLRHICVNVYLSAARSIVVVAVPVSDVLSEILG